MRLDRLDIHGLLALRTVSLDFRTIPQGLIAIVGANGAGKTTLLEAPFAGTYRTLPSRDDVLVDCATEADSSIDVLWGLESGAYRARVSLDAVRRTSDAVLQVDGPGGTVLNDGKVTTFDRAVKEHFPTLDFLLAAALACQNKRGNFIGKSPKEKSELFTQLLGLSGMLRLSETAKQAAACYESAIGTVRAQIAEIGSLLVLDPPARLDQEAGHLEQDEEAARTSRAELTERILTLEAQLAVMGDALVAYTTGQQRLREVTSAIQGRDAELAALDREAVQVDARAGKDAENARAKAGTEHVHARQRRDAVIADNRKKIDGNTKVLGQAEAIRAAIARVEAIATEAATLRTQIDDARRTKDATVEQRRATEETLYALGRVEIQLATAKSDATLLARVPFGERCLEAGCEFVQQAGAAKALIPALETQLAPKADHEILLAAYATGLNGLSARLSELGRQEHDLNSERGRLAALTQYADALAAADAKIAGYQAAIAKATVDCVADEERIDANLTSELDAISDRQAREHAGIAERRAEVTAARDTLDRTRIEVERVIQETAAGNDLAVRTKVHLEDARRAFDDTTGTLARIAAERTALTQRRLAVETAILRQRSLVSEQGILATEHGEWQQLQRALGREGIPVLEIDAAGPIVSKYTNDLLTAAFGPRFSVELVTQQAKVDGGMKEAFDLLVTDNERGGKVRKVASLSGGEQIIVSEALMNALALYVNEHLSTPLRTAWRDETTGALDIANRPRYIEMLRKVQQIGGYAQVLYITHEPEIAALADAQIVVANGTATVQLQPYDVSIVAAA